MNTLYQEYTYQNPKPAHSHAYIYPHLIKLLRQQNSKTILDVGCGNGGMAKMLIREGFNVYGIDASKSGISLAQQNYPERFYISDINNMELPEPLKQITFDTVISTEVIEHVYSPRRFVMFCRDIVLRGKGCIMLSTPYHGYWKNLLLALTNKLDDHFTVLWEGGHIKFFSKRTIKQLLKEEGFSHVTIYGCGRVPFLWKSMLVKAIIQ